MGHDAHFLSRLSRVSREHTELALSLYRDPELVRDVFRRSDVPESAPRVAVSLADPVEGPFVVLERDGHFVTCLGAGMRASDLPLVTRAKLDAVASRLERLREQMEAARRAAGTDEKDLSLPLLRKLTHEPENISREDVMGLRAWLSVTSGSLLGWCIDTLSKLHLEAERMRSGGAAPDVRERRRLALGRALEALSIALQVLAADVHAYAPAFPEPIRVDILKLLVTTPDMHLCERTLARTLNGLARGGKWLLGPAKEIARKSPNFGQYRLVLRAIGQGQPKLRAEVAKAMESIWGVDAAAMPAAWDEAQQRIEHVRADVLADVRAQNPHFTDESARGVWGPATMAHFGRAIAFRGNRNPLTIGLPVVSMLEPEDLYPPQAVQSVFPVRDTPELADVFADEMHRWFAPEPARREAAPGRNDPCPCGSGRKHKKCCGAAG